MSVRWSEGDLDEALQGDATVQDEVGEAEDMTNRSPALQGIAKGSTPRGEMNNTERRWARRLDASEEVLWWAYETIRVRYGDGGWHSPDFVLCRLDGSLEVHETKGGHMTDAGRTRFKAAAGAFPVARWLMMMQAGKRQPWVCRYDTAGEEGAPFV
jgi:hypothetical protein